MEIGLDPDGNLDWFEGLIKRGIKLGLDNMRELLERLGNPQEGIRFIHVAGTDGKGSVCAMITSILGASGYSVGSFTSPHILRINEQITFEGECILDSELDNMLSMVRPHVEAMAEEGMLCTNFEVLTATALLYFKILEAEIAVIEVGMGGRMDSTNLITPEVTVINNIGMEHSRYLGSTIEEIAYEKAGIMKPGVPCVTINKGKVLDVLMAYAEKVEAPLTQVSEREFEVVESAPESIDMLYRGERYRIGLPGRHQAGNAALAIAAVSILDDYVDRIADHVDEGLENAFWPCRMEKMLDMPIVLDVTHTRTGAVCLHNDVSEIYGKVVLVFGMLDDKDVDGVAAQLAPVAERIFVTQPVSPRAKPKEDVEAVVRKYHDTVECCDTVSEAMDRAMECRGDLNVLVTGSFRMAGDALEWVQKLSSKY